MSIRWHLALNSVIFLSLLLFGYYLLSSSSRLSLLLAPIFLGRLYHGKIVLCLCPACAWPLIVLLVLNTRCLQHYLVGVGVLVRRYLGRGRGSKSNIKHYTLLAAFSCASSGPSVIKSSGELLTANDAAVGSRKSHSFSSIILLYPFSFLVVCRPWN